MNLVRRHILALVPAWRARAKSSPDAFRDAGKCVLGTPLCEIHIEHTWTYCPLEHMRLLYVDGVCLCNLDADAVVAVIVENVCAELTRHDVGNNASVLYECLTLDDYTLRIALK